MCILGVFNDPLTRSTTTRNVAQIWPLTLSPTIEMKMSATLSMKSLQYTRKSYLIHTGEGKFLTSIVICVFPIKYARVNMLSPLNR